MLADGRTIVGLRFTYVRYRPRKRVLVRYEVTCGPETHMLVAQASADGRLASRAARRESIALPTSPWRDDRLHGGRSPTTTA